MITSEIKKITLSNDKVAELYQNNNGMYGVEIRDIENLFDCAGIFGTQFEALKWIEKKDLIS